MLFRSPPLQIGLDDAELADLVRVLDQVRLDSRLQLPFELPADRPLKAREVLKGTPLTQRLAAPVGGAVLVALAASLSLLVPQPKRPPSLTPTTAKPALPQSNPARP